MSFILVRNGTNKQLSDFKTMYEYLTEDFKTKNKKFVYVFGSLTNDPLSEMIATKTIYGKTGGRQYVQIIGSATPVGNELSDDDFFEMSKEIGRFYYDLGFYVTVTNHFDTDTRHFHLNIDTVSIKTGKKFTQSISQLNRFKAHCNRVFSKYGLDIIKLRTDKLIDKKEYSFDNGFDFLEAYDEIKYDKATCLMEALESSVSLGYTGVMAEEETKRMENPDAPHGSFNHFLYWNDDNYKDMWDRAVYIRSQLNWGLPPYFNPDSIRPISFPSIEDFAPPPIIIKDQTSTNTDRDEFVFGVDGSLLRINCSRIFEINVPEGYSEKKVRDIVDNLPRLTEDEKRNEASIAAKVADRFKRSNVDIPVELDFSETVTFNWSDGTSSTIPKLKLPKSDYTDIILEDV